jgi:hypothetical protein
VREGGGVCDTLYTRVVHVGLCDVALSMHSFPPLAVLTFRTHPKDYKPEYYFWEVLECLRKLLLTGVAIQIAPGSLLQLIVNIFIIGVYVGLVAFFQPYLHKRDNTLALAIYAVIAVTLFCGLLLKVKDGYERCVHILKQTLLIARSDRRFLFVWCASPNSATVLASTTMASARLQ